MSSTDDSRCRALTEDGERCTRPAGSDGFCYQHDESDPTVDEDESDAVNEDDSDAVNEDDSDESSGSAGASGGDAGGDAGRAQTGGDQPQAASEVVSVRETVRDVGRELIGHDLESVIAVERDGDGWRVTVEVVERPAVPDTQDILGRYEVELDDEPSVSGYRRLGRYRRADTTADDARD